MPRLRRSAPRCTISAAISGLWLLVSGPVLAQPSDSGVEFDVQSGDGIVWEAELGSYSYGGPVVAGDKIFVGTNNSAPRDAETVGDRGVLMALRAGDGQFLWQATHLKLEQDLDFPLQGLCSTPAVVGDRIYYISNRAELISADVEGFRDGTNDGPLRDESLTRGIDADFVWRLDMRAELGVVPHFMAASTPHVEGDLVFAVTGNGIAEGGGVPAPDAPGFVAVRRDSGEVVWSDASSSAALLDGQWGSPRWLRTVAGEQVVFPGGDGRLYGFDPVLGKPRWQFNGNTVPGGSPAEGREKNVFVASPVIAEGRLHIALGRDPEEGSADGGVWTLEIDEDGEPTLGWFFGGEDFGRAIADVAVADGVVYAADLNGFVVALDADSGLLRWRYDALAPIWATPVVSPEGLWVADVDGEVTLLGTGPEMKVLAEFETFAPIYRGPVPSGRRLYLMTTERLYAIRRGE